VATIWNSAIEYSPHFGVFGWHLKLPKIVNVSRPGLVSQNALSVYVHSPCFSLAAQSTVIMGYTRAVDKDVQLVYPCGQNEGGHLNTVWCGKQHLEKV